MLLTQDVSIAQGNGQLAYQSLRTPSKSCHMRFGTCESSRHQGKKPRLTPDSDSHLQNWIPSDVAEVADSDIDPKLLEDEKWVEDNLLPKWASLRIPVHPEPSPFLAQCYKVHDEMRLANKFAKSGLQVIIKIASIELTPEHSKFAAGSWHVSLSGAPRCIAQRK